MSGEFARIARLSQIYAGSHAGLTLGIGDDCAVLASTAGTRVWTVDAAVECVHFDRAFMALFDVGYRAFTAAASDVAAMGARADSALSALILPRSFADEELYTLAEGIAAAARAVGCAVAGGNLARGGALSITTSVLGVAEGRVVTRSGARVGDGVFVTGVLGAAALGLCALRSAAPVPEPLATVREACVRHFLAPRARFDRAPLLARVATAAIDVSDGLAQDLGHIAQASQVRIALDPARVPRVPHFQALAAALCADATALVLAGGDDYPLAFTAPPGSVPPDQATQIGEVVAGDPGVLGVPEGAAGHDHFRG